MFRVYKTGVFQTIHIHNRLCLYSEFCHKPYLNVAFLVQSTMAKIEGTNEIKIKKNIQYVHKY